MTAAKKPARKSAKQKTVTVDARGASPCTCCGMFVKPAEYHPYAACLMYRGCDDAAVVTANLRAVLLAGRNA